MCRIVDKNQLKEWIKKDYEAYNMHHPVISRLTCGENWALFSYQRNLRYLEYYLNKKHMPWDIFFRVWHWLRHRRNCARMGIFIAPNSVGPGLHLQHRGFRHLNSNVRIGENCEILPMVLMGNKRKECQGEPIVIGDGCYISAGVTILGPITIGKNVTIAAGAVVNKDVPSNVVVAGVPAKTVKTKDELKIK